MPSPVDVNFALLVEGNSDEGLLPHLRQLIVEAGAARASGERVRLHGPLVDRITELASWSTYNLLFVHKDADRPEREPRVGQIAAAVRRSAWNGEHVPVVPVQEMEAWLLVDEAQIRAIAGRPNGRVSLNLPRLGRIENTPNPKEVLKAAYMAACESSGRRHQENARLLFSRGFG
ncbi:DUF4276 family protein [Microbacterium aurum]|uniref:DUF4276 family protein n=1 Tax=Microbacterium aurum TaxID=36805 RepID=UPI0028E65707|nr:DUF4276 family protein [Microbacterium aurum]